MRTRKILMTAAVMLLFQNPCLAMSGLEWLELSVGDRMEEVLKAMYTLDQSGVTLSQTPNDYYNLVEAKIRRDHGLYTTEVTNILASAVYDKEPATRPALDKLKI